VYRFRISSRLAADPPVLWEHATSIAGVNEELWPIRMSAPRARLDGEIPLGERLFVSRVTLFGVIPLDLHALALASLEPGKGFVERSKTLLERTWEHRRNLALAPEGGTELVDEVSFEPRLFGSVVQRVVASAFRRRHRVLRRKFGGGDAEPRIEWL
jgi:ligand-binding SRPBCC domain-containing protein